MSLETQIQKLTAAVEALTARLTSSYAAVQTIWQHTSTLPEIISTEPAPTVEEEIAAVKAVVTPIDPIPQPVPPELYAFSALKSRCLELRGDGKYFKDTPEMTAKLFNKHGAKTLSEATDAQRCAIYKDVVEIEQSLKSS